ncbi:MAG: cyclic nucleotide-binding protein [Bacteroidota bacterium]|nr:cyclic nucleotide-binding protein [Bacteroidota bacterium]
MFVINIYRYVCNKPMTRQIDKILENKAKQFLKQTLRSTMNVNEEDLNALVQLFELVSYKKNDIILDEGQVAEYFYFIYSGVIKIFFYKNNKDIIEGFEKEGAFFGSNFTHITKKPGTHIYQALEDLALLKIAYKDLNALCKKSHDIERLYRLNLELLHSNYVNRFYTFASLQADEKYHQFMQDYGDIANRIPLKYIANYLGMTSETLSRVRSKYDKTIKSKV